MVYLDCVNTMLRSITEYQIANQFPIFTVYYLQRIVHISCLIFIIIFFFFKIKVASNFLVPRMSQWNQVENLAPLKKIKNLPIRSLLLLGLDFLFRKWQILYGKQIKMRRPPPPHVTLVTRGHLLLFSKFIYHHWIFGYEEDLVWTLLK